MILSYDRLDVAFPTWGRHGVCFKENEKVKIEHYCLNLGWVSYKILHFSIQAYKPGRKPLLKYPSFFFSDRNHTISFCIFVSSSEKLSKSVLNLSMGAANNPANPSVQGPLVGASGWLFVGKICFVRIKFLVIFLDSLFDNLASRRGMFSCDSCSTCVWRSCMSCSRRGANLGSVGERDWRTERSFLTWELPKFAEIRKGEVGAIETEGYHTTWCCARPTFVSSFPSSPNISPWRGREPILVIAWRARFHMSRLCHFILSSALLAFFMIS